MVHIVFIGVFAVFTALSCAAKRERPSNSPPVRFEKTVLTSDFISEGVCVADINGDGLTDIIAGAYWFEAPHWEKHELAIPQTFDYATGYSNSFLNYAMDVDQDGWIDVIRIDIPGEAVSWYKNPGKDYSKHWKEEVIYPNFGNENPLMADVDGDGRLDLIGNDPVREEVIWLRAPKEKGDTKWEKFIISDVKGRATHKYTHGLGFGDINGDGRNDVMVHFGWWEMPEDPKQSNWTFHYADLGRECAQMYVFDVDRDGLNDVISSSAHNYGIWWHKHTQDHYGHTSFSQREIYAEFSQTHALAFDDINGDGKKDLVSGKRFYAHMLADPGATEPAVLYWFEHVERDGISAWIPHFIDDDSGVGYQIVVEDMNNDGLPDIVVANKKGVHFFKQSRN